MPKQNNKAKKTKRAKRANKRSQPPRPARVARTPKIADCTFRYAEVLTNPFRAMERSIRAPCVPDSMVFPSVKHVFVCRGSMTTSSGGLGFVALDPYGISDSTGGVHYSNAASSGSGPFDSWGSLSHVPFAQVPWTSGDYAGGGIRTRVVGAGLRIRYADRAVDRGGTAYAARQPMNGNILGRSLPNLAGQPWARYFPIDRDYLTVTWKPVDPEDASFRRTAGVSTPTDAPLIIALDSASPNTVFYWEAVIYVETVGAKSASVPTKSESDPVGYGAVQEINQSHGDSWVGEGWTSNDVLDLLRNEVMTMTGVVANTVSASLIYQKLRSDNHHRAQLMHDAYV